MYARQVNPLSIVARRSPGGRFRARVGAEFSYCPDGTMVKGNATAAKCGIPPTVTTSTPSGGGTGTGGWGPGTPPPTIIETTIPTATPGTPWRPPTPTGCRPVCNPCPENQKRYYMPFVPQAGYTASVTAGSSVIFVGRPQKLFAPDRLIIGSTIGAYFDVVSLTIGNIPQSLSAGNVGAEMFSEVATYVMMTFDQAYPGIDIILTATNKSSVTQTFQAQLVGEAVG